MNSRLRLKRRVILSSAALLLLNGCEASSTQSRATTTPGLTMNANQGAAASSKKVYDQPSLIQIKLLPIDEGISDPSLQEFRSNLLSAIQRQDTNQILTVLHPYVDNGYDIRPGIEEFKNRWKPEESESLLWSVLLPILKGGGTFGLKEGQREFCGPYVVSEWSKVVHQLPEGTDSLDYVAITGENINVRTEPASNAPVLTSLSYDVVKIVPSSEVPSQPPLNGSSWVRIMTPDGDEGYVPENYVQGPMDYGACFTKINGKWLITALAATE